MLPRVPKMLTCSLGLDSGHSGCRMHPYRDGCFKKQRPCCNIDPKIVAALILQGHLQKGSEFVAIAIAANCPVVYMSYERPINTSWLST